MKFQPALIEGKFLKRYKRFFADFELQQKIEVAHVANTGSMKSCNEPGAACLVSPASNPERKLRWTLEAIKAPTGSWVGVNTARPNMLVKEAFENHVISDWQQFQTLQAEVKLNAQTRLDFVFSAGAKKRFIEVKNVTLADGDVALFPDAVTERGQKHIKELMELIAQGHEAELVFVVQRSDCRTFSPADAIDPEYGRLLREAQKKGLLISAYLVKFSKDEIQLTNEKLQVQL